MILDRLRRDEHERAYCYAVLDLWARVQDQGIEIESVSMFGYDPALSAKAPTRKQQASCVEVLPNGERRLRVYNYVSLKDGTRTTLDPVLKAVYP